MQYLNKHGHDESFGHLGMVLWLDRSAPLVSWLEARPISEEGSAAPVLTGSCAAPTLPGASLTAAKWYVTVPREQADGPAGRSGTRERAPAPPGCAMATPLQNEGAGLAQARHRARKAGPSPRRKARPPRWCAPRAPSRRGQPLAALLNELGQRSYILVIARCFRQT